MTASEVSCAPPGPALDGAEEQPSGIGFWALTPFYCPDCALNYCAADWDITRGEDEGFREPTMGRCPAGHEHMLDENLTPDPEPDPGILIRLDSSRSFDGQERVLPVAAYDQHLSCTDHSAIGLHPGSSATTTSTASERAPRPRSPS
jgi:hypothetical protein